MLCWHQDRFDAAGVITMEMAARALRIDATPAMKQKMLAQLNQERQMVRLKMKEQVHELLRMGTGITKMTYTCMNSSAAIACVSPKSMRDSYIQDGTLLNIRAIHWIFHELPFATHRDVLPQRKSHMDLVVEQVAREMSITWAPMRDAKHGIQRNCLEQVYSKMLNDKKQTIVKGAGTTHGRKPMVRRPKTAKAAGNCANYKRGKNMYSWQSDKEGNHQVSNALCVIDDLQPTNNLFLC